MTTYILKFSFNVTFFINMKKCHYYGNLQNMHYIHFIRVKMNLPWQPFPESKTPATDKCVITPDEFARTQNRYALVNVKGLLQKTVCP